MKKDPRKMTLQALAKHLNIDLGKAIEIVKYAHNAMREDLINWLNHPEKWESNQ